MNAETPIFATIRNSTISLVQEYVEARVTCKSADPEVDSEEYDRLVERFVETEIAILDCTDNHPDILRCQLAIMEDGGNVFPGHEGGTLDRAEGRCIRRLYDRLIAESESVQHAIRSSEIGMNESAVRSDPDADLLALCEQFFAHWRGQGAAETEDATDAANMRRDAARDAVMTIAARTPVGLAAKARVLIEAGSEVNVYPPDHLRALVVDAYAIAGVPLPNPFLSCTDAAVAKEAERRASIIRPTAKEWVSLAIAAGMEPTAMIDGDRLSLHWKVDVDGPRPCIFDEEATGEVVDILLAQGRVIRLAPKPADG